MKKHKSHARHVFSYLETQFGVKVTFNDDESSSKKGSKLSNVSKNSNFSESSLSKNTRISNPEKV